MTRNALTARERLKGELQRSVERVRAELDKIEILSAAMSAFSQPVPKYEPSFVHMRHATASAVELNKRNKRH